MTTPRPPIQLMLDLPMAGRGEAPRPLAQEVEVATAIAEPERPAQTASLMEAICDPENIEAALRAVVRNKGVFEASREGTPQGGPLSPLLSNLVLDELDRELERRGHRFVRYADDCNVYVRS